MTVYTAWLICCVIKPTQKPMMPATTRITYNKDEVSSLSQPQTHVIDSLSSLLPFIVHVRWQLLHPFRHVRHYRIHDDRSECSFKLVFSFRETVKKSLRIFSATSLKKNPSLNSISLRSNEKERKQIVQKSVSERCEEARKTLIRQESFYNQYISYCRKWIKMSVVKETRHAYYGQGFLCEHECTQTS